jgi:hypothetical protein
MDTVPQPGKRLTGPRPPAAEEVAAFVVAAVCALPVRNTRPWVFRADGQSLSLISYGAALFTFRLVLRSLGYLPHACVLPDPGQPLLAARVSWQRQASPTVHEQHLFRQVRRRRTDRGGFGPRPLAPGPLAVLHEGAARQGALQRSSADQEGRAGLTAAIQTAERAAARRRARQGTGPLGPPPGSTCCDGVPPTSYPARPEHTDPHFPSRDFAHGRRWGMRPFSWAAPRATGVVGLLIIVGDRAVDWMNAGQAQQRLLTGTTCGVAAALHSQPLELAWLRQFIRAHLGEGTYPQMVLRLGTVIQTAVSVRRPPASILVAGSGGHERISHG